MLPTMAYSQFANSSILATGRWEAFAIEQSGMYRITYQQLESLGLSPSSLTPQQLHLYGFGGILPQANQAIRPADLPQIPVWVKGGEDGSFDDGDELVFYAQGPHTRSYAMEEDWAHERNPYTDKAFYFLHIGEEAPLAPTQYNSGSSPASQSIAVFEEHLWIEPEETSVISSGREWYSNPFGLDNEQIYKLTMEGLSSGNIQVQFQGLARSRQSGVFSVMVNEQPLGEVPYSSTIIDTYNTWGSIASQTLEGAFEPDGEALDIKLGFTRGEASSLGYLDYLRVQVPRKLGLYGNQTAFRHRLNAAEPILFQFEELPASARVWHIGDPTRPQAVELQRSGQTASFMAKAGVEYASGEVPEYIVFQAEDLPLPTWVESIDNQNLHALEPTNLLIITPTNLKDQAQRLADFRISHDNLTAQVTALEQIYWEFGFGQPSPTAIRDFIRSLYLKNESGSKELKYVLLLGDATYDYLGRVFDQTNTVPIYQSRNSIHPLLTYSSDDYFGFMDASEGDWVELGNGLNSHTLDIGVGRLPAPDIESARTMVDKLIAYSQSPQTLGAWRQKLLFTADDGDGNLHQKDADSLARMTERLYPAYHARRLFVDDYEQINIGGGKRSPKAKQAVQRFIEDGALIVNFTGHGSETGWTSEAIMDNPLALSLNNPNKLALFVTATCEFGRYDNPSRDSGAELLLKNENGGAIGLLTTTRPVLSFSNFRVNRAFYQACFEPLPTGEMPRLGDIMRYTKNNSLNGVNNRNFALLGDPSMQLAYPKDQIIAHTINNQPITNNDTIQALSSVTIEANVYGDDGDIDRDFDGWANVLVYDRPAEKQTIGDGEENNKMVYTAYLHKLFEGVVPISNGSLTATFTVPKDIAYDYGQGKIIFYAQSSTGLKDAQGSLNVRIGGSQGSPSADANPPEMTAWLESSSFENGQEVSRQPLLYVRLSDDSGLNLTGRGVGHDLIAVIDQQEEHTYPLNSYFKLDTSSYKSGELYFSIPEQLEVGQHHITVAASDSYNNRTSLTLNFVVRQQIQLTQIVAYPNPFTDQLSISFIQDRVGDDFDIKVGLYKMDGQLISELNKAINRADRQIVVEWGGIMENGAKLRPGMYIVRLELTSKTDSETVMRTFKVVR